MVLENVWEGKEKEDIFLFNDAPNTFIGIRIPLWIITFEFTQTTFESTQIPLYITTFESTQIPCGLLHLNLLRSPVDYYI